MTVLRKIILSTTAVATLATAASPAFARPGYGYGRGGYNHYHRGGGDVGGALVGGLIVGGLIGVLAASSSRDRAPRAAYRGGAPEDRAAQVCAAAVEGERGGRIERIWNVRPYGDGWNVEGTIDARDLDARGYGRVDSFSCNVRYGRVEDVRYGSEYSRR